MCDVIGDLPLLKNINSKGGSLLVRGTLVNHWVFPFQGNLSSRVAFLVLLCFAPRLKIPGSPKVRNTFHNIQSSNNIPRMVQPQHKEAQWDHQLSLTFSVRFIREDKVVE